MSYQVTKLDAPSPFIAFYTAQITDEGIIPGYARSVTPTQIRAAWWSASTGFIEFVADGTLGATWAGAVLPSGELVGQVRPQGADYGFPVVFSEGGYRSLPLPPGLFGAARLTYENTIVGIAFDPEAVTQHVAVWDNEKLLGIVSSLPAVVSIPRDINSHGQYVGVMLDDAYYGGFLGQELSAAPLTYPGIGHVGGQAINDSGTIAGAFYPDGYTRTGFIGHGDHAELTLPLPGDIESPIFGINNNDDMVGVSANANGYETATVYFAGSTTPVDMNTLIDPIPGVHLVRGIDINNLGQILVEGETPQGYRYYVLTPIPEPATLCWGAVFFVGLRLRNRRIRESQDAPRHP